MQPIIVGFLDVETAHKAVAEAASIAARLGAPLHVVTALEDPTVEVVDAGGEQFMFDDYRLAEETIERFMRDLPDRPAHTVAVVQGKAPDVLISEAERLDAQMIVVGNVRMQGPGRLLGSVGNKVVHHAPCSVLIAKTV